MQRPSSAQQQQGEALDTNPKPLLTSKSLLLMPYESPNICPFPSLRCRCSIIMRDVASFICDDKRVRARLFGGAFDPSHYNRFSLMSTQVARGMPQRCCCSSSLAALDRYQRCSVKRVLGFELFHSSPRVQFSFFVCSITTWKMIMALCTVCHVLSPNN